MNTFPLSGGGSKTLTKDASIVSCKRESFQEPLKVSLSLLEDGAKTLNTEAALTYEKIFYKEIQARPGQIYGFHMRKGNWCNSYLKMAALRRAMKSFLPVPPHRGLKNILWWSIWELPLTSLNALNAVTA